MGAGWPLSVLQRQCFQIVATQVRFPPPPFRLEFPALTIFLGSSVPIRCPDRLLNVAPHCVEHDVAYWYGGPAEVRKRADDAFRACIRAAGGPCLSTHRYVGVRVGGPAWMPFPWRWGYGWDWLEDPS